MQLKSPTVMSNSIFVRVALLMVCALMSSFALAQNNALTFDGVDDYVSISDDATFSNCLEGWEQLDDFNCRHELSNCSQFYHWKKGDTEALIQTQKDKIALFEECQKTHSPNYIIAVNNYIESLIINQQLVLADQTLKRTSYFRLENKSLEARLFFSRLMHELNLSNQLGKWSDTIKKWKQFKSQIEQQLELINQADYNSLVLSKCIALLHLQKLSQCKKELLLLEIENNDPKDKLLMAFLMLLIDLLRSEKNAVVPEILEPYLPTGRLELKNMELFLSEQFNNAISGQFSFNELQRK